jgi:DUF1680 family protein
MAGPLAPTEGALHRLRPLAFDGARITAGLWADRQRVNREVTIPIGADKLEAAGSFENFKAARTRHPSEYHGQVYQDGEVYKWLEALAWEQARGPSEQFARWQRDVSRLVANAQEPDGYLNTFVQVANSERFANLEHHHEIFNVGALVQAAVAQVRTGNDDGLSEVAERAAHQLGQTFGPDRRHGVCGHPLIEMALIELFRVTAQREYLELAGYFVDQRGKQTLSPPASSLAYFSDRVPVREATSVEGHAVRALYLAAGATDLGTESHDERLLAAVQRQWEHMVATKMYLTGGLGSRWEGEAFGDPFELPSDRAHCETCAAVASVQWSWRLLLLTGQARFADLIERTLFNALLPAVSLSGDTFFYVNVLQLRADAHPDDQDRRSAGFGRQPWFGTSCCPTNLMRTMSVLHHYFFTKSGEGIEIHQYAPAEVRTRLRSTPVALDVATDYPWDGVVVITVRETGDLTWALSLRIPGWALGAGVSVNDAEVPHIVEPGSYVRLERPWKPGDRVALTLPLTPRVTRANHRIDAIRGCAAIERGPLVYCLEQADQDTGVLIDDVCLENGDLVSKSDPNVLGGAVTIDVPGGRLNPRLEPSPYCTENRRTNMKYREVSNTHRAQLSAVPYYAWANRGVGAMRVWIPLP